MMQDVVIDFSTYPDLAAFHRDIAERLDFPDYYGENLDALHDVIAATPVDRWRFTCFFGGTGISRRDQVTIAKILMRKE